MVWSWRIFWNQTVNDPYYIYGFLQLPRANLKNIVGLKWYDMFQEKKSLFHEVDVNFLYLAARSYDLITNKVSWLDIGVATLLSNIYQE